MDDGYLLALQELRESLPSFVEQIMVPFSAIGDGPAVVVLLVIVYWCVDKRTGQFAFTAFSSCNCIAQLIKNIACVYRPWVRNPAIVPAQGSIECAAGYSFPSGHTTSMATSMGSFALFARKNHKGIAIICVASILLMMFSRNFLGVHTPEDVLVGCLLAVAMIALTAVFFNWMDRCDELQPGHNKDIVVMVVVLVVCAASVAFVALKPYPMDYVDGKLLVDPVTMQKGSFEAAGIFAGWIIAWVLERRLVRFTTDGLDMRTRLTRFAIGFAIAGASYLITDVVFKAIMPYNWAKLFAMLVVFIVAGFVSPLAFSKFEQRKTSSKSKTDR